VPSTTVNSTRFGPQTSWPALAMITGRMVGAVAGGPQPARSSGGAGAVGQAALPDGAADACGLPDGVPTKEQAAVMSERAMVAAASAPTCGERGGMATAYPWIAKGGAVREARIRRRHPEDS
jgi:hypothetical protein